MEIFWLRQASFKEQTPKPLLVTDMELSLAGVSGCSLGHEASVATVDPWIRCSFEAPSGAQVRSPAPWKEVTGKMLLSPLSTEA